MSQTIKSAGDEDSQHEDSPMFSTKQSKKLMSTNRSDRSLTDLPLNVLVEILARLPLRTLFVARSLCKTFSFLTISNPQFINLHSSYAAQILVFQFGEFGGLRFHIPSCLLRFADKELDYKNSELKPLFQLPQVGDDRHRTLLPQASCFFLVNSCNGLLLFLHDGIADFCSSLVCNPVTNEYMLIPEVDPNVKSGSLTRSMCLGYTSSTDQYKVLRIFSRTGTPCNEFSAQVSVIGSDSWRHIDGTPLWRTHMHRDLPGALVNEVMYWHHPSWSDLFSFDFEGEKFREVALPPEFQRGLYTSIGVLGGCLCLTCNDSNGHRVDLWVMRKCGNQDSWRKEFVVDTGRPVYSHFRPLQFLRNGEILMLIMLLAQYSLVCYDPSSKNLRYFGLNERLKLSYRAVVLTPSFVPLKDTLKVDNVLNGIRPRGEEEEL